MSGFSLNTDLWGKWLLFIGIIFLALQVFAEQIPVKFPEGLAHGFLVLRDEGQKIIASGDLEQTVQESIVTSKLRFQFLDSSIYEEDTVFSQNKFFRVISYHLLEQGPSFKNPIEVWVDCSKGDVKMRDLKGGNGKITIQHLALPPDIANGIISTIIEDFATNAPHTVSLLAATPKARIVEMEITPEGDDPFIVGTHRYNAERYVGKIKIGGLAGAIAPLVGKKPPDAHFWVLRGDAPTFMKSTSVLATGGPVWEIDLASPRGRRQTK